MMIGLKPYTPPACIRETCTAAVAWQVLARSNGVTQVIEYYCEDDLPDRHRRLLEGGPRSHASVGEPAPADTVAPASGPDTEVLTRLRNVERLALMTYQKAYSLPPAIGAPSHADAVRYVVDGMGGKADPR